MSAKFKKGDVVILTCRNIREARVSDVGFNRYMECMLGEMHVIKRVRYRVDEWVYYMEGSQWMWREDWLLPVCGRVDRY